ncbi:MAG: purine-nucleoside phosphorylase, partial [Terracoccus sp.]
MTTTTSTPHINPSGVVIADTILLPGDPLRAKFIAETYFDDARCFNQVRGMLGFTGTYRGKPVSVMGTGMGIPSISLYSYELIHFFDVKNLIRVGTCGAMQPDMELYDVV